MEGRIQIILITRGEGVVNYLVDDLPVDIPEEDLSVPSHQVRRIFNHCYACGSMIPSDYVQIHFDPAIHSGYKLTMHYLSFSKHFEGVYIRKMI